MRLHRRVGEIVDGNEETERRLELVPDLAVEVAQVAWAYKVLLPLRLKQVIRAVEAECAVDLLPFESEGGLWVEVEQREDVSQHVLQPVPPGLRLEREELDVGLTQRLETLLEGVAVCGVGAGGFAAL